MVSLIRTKTIITFALIFAGSAGLAGCSYHGTFTQKNNEPVTVNDFKLDTYVSITCYDDTDEIILKEALGLCDKYDNIFSMYKEGSELWRINENKTTDVSPELGYVLERSLYMSRLSQGSFQISVGRVSELWDFNSSEHHIPDGDAIKKALSTVDDSRIKIEPKYDPAGGWTISKPDDTKIDLGAVSKGYIADKIKEYLKDNGIEHAIINLGGNVLCVGDKFGSDFNIGIRKPFAGTSDTSAVLSLSDRSVVSSGISERYFEGEDGHIYHHILDPETGYPYDNGLWQTTIITDDALSGDCLSTLCFTMGPEKGLELAQEEGAEAVFITDDGQLRCTPGAEALIH